jgi:hypothetical protein
MEQRREQFMEPEIVKHEEKVADVTATIKSPIGDDIATPR